MSARDAMLLGEPFSCDKYMWASPPENIVLHATAPSLEPLRIKGIVQGLISSPFCGDRRGLVKLIIIPTGLTLAAT